MHYNQDYIPLAIAKLLIAYFNQTITQEEHNMLDEWLANSYDNMEIFSECIDINARPFVYDPEREELQSIIPDRILLN